jgi:hypothetical protein
MSYRIRQEIADFLKKPYEMDILEKIVWSATLVKCGDYWVELGILKK